jgi:hypothetical protein
MVALNDEIFGDLSELMKCLQMNWTDFVVAMERFVKNFHRPYDDVAARVPPNILLGHDTMTVAYFRTELFDATSSALAVFRNFGLRTRSYTSAVVLLVKVGTSVDTVAAINQVPVGSEDESKCRYWAKLALIY